MNYYLYPSNLKTKKYTVKFINQATNKINTIHFGAYSYDDYTITNNDERKELYKLRHINDNINDLTKPGCWSWWLLWNLPTLDESIRDMEQTFGIDINHCM